jgi:hypothetical protein
VSILDLFYPTDHIESVFTYACQKPPKGWSCTRPNLHEGPCAAVPDAPDPRQHFWISMAKSAVRILACLFFFKQFPISAGLLLLAEAIGILEEMV